VFDRIVAPFPDAIPSIQAQVPRPKRIESLLDHARMTLPQRSSMTAECMQMGAETSDLPRNYPFTDSICFLSLR
jgi:hypothetical protein